MATIKVFTRDDLDLTLSFKDSSNNALDITGYTVFLTVKTNKTDADIDALLSATVTSHTDPTNGITVVSFTDAETDITAGSYYYDIQTKDTSGKIKTWGVGNFVVEQDVTIRTS